MLIMLLLGDIDSPSLSHPADAELLVDIWKIKSTLAGTGLFLDEEVNHTLPPWHKWAIVSAKRRTIMSLHHIEFVWSLLHGYPPLTCFELGPLPAPAAGALWKEADQKEWGRQYEDWLVRWKDGCYKVGELFHVTSDITLDVRSEMWLAEVDEFGLMIMSEGEIHSLTLLTGRTDNSSECD